MCVSVQFIATVVKNVEALSGSAVQVTIDSVTAGSVKVASTVVFLSGDSASASSYQAAITSGDPTSVFGSSFGAVAVDTSSIKASTVSNPGDAHCHATQIDTVDVLPDCAYCWLACCVVGPGTCVWV